MLYPRYLLSLDHAKKEVKVKGSFYEKYSNSPGIATNWLKEVLGYVLRPFVCKFDEQIQQEVTP